MIDDLLLVGEIVAGGLAVGAGVTTLVFNTVFYFTTLDVARRQEKWTSEQWKEKCDMYWKENIIRDDLSKYEKRRAKILTNILAKPGMYLGCKYLSYKGK